jgi:hypothetical protein
MQLHSSKLQTPSTNWSLEMLERLHALLLAITGPAGCELEGDALDAYLAQCLELVSRLRSAAAEMPRHPTFDIERSDLLSRRAADIA